MAITPGEVQVAPDSTGKKVDNVILATDKFRQVVAIGDPEDRAKIAKVTDAAPGGSDLGLVVRTIVATLPLPTGAATEATLAAIATDVDRIPASPAAEHTTAGSPSSARLSDGAAFYEAAKTGQLPAALVSGRLDVNIGASPATLPVSGPLTDAQLRATPVPVSGTVTATGPLTDAQLRATAVPVSGTVSTKTALTAASPAAATVGTGSALALAANGARRGLVLVNTSDNTISLGIGATAVSGSGITLQPGGSWTMTEYTFTTAAINAIASAGSSNLAIQEFT